MSKPKITVFMAAYNAADFICESILSILNQTFKDFELIIVNDGSTDDTVLKVEDFNDPRIRLIHNDGNKGLQFTRNRLIDLARGKYIAVLDSDDIAYPNRLEVQYNFLEANQDMALCGSHAEIINENGIIQDRKLIVPTNEQINMEMLFCNPFINSSTMFKTEVFRELNGYRNLALAEDFDLFVRISEKYMVANVDSILTKYRIHGNNITLKRSKDQLDCEQEILRNTQASLGMQKNDFFLDLHLELFTSNVNEEHLFEYLQLFKAMKIANITAKRFDIAKFNYFLFEKWQALIKTRRANKKALNWYFDKGLFTWSYFSFKQFRRMLKISLRGL